MSSPTSTCGGRRWRAGARPSSRPGSWDDPPPNKGGILTPYDGAEKMGKRGIGGDKLVPKVYPPQLTQINTAFNGRIDALLMNLGGNDAGFAALIQECLNIVVIGDCHNKEVVNAFVNQKLGVLNSRFNRLALALEGNAQSGDPELEQVPRDVFLTKAPMPLRPGGATSVCDRTPAGNYEENLKAVETQWLIDRVVESTERALRDRGRRSTAGTSSTSTSTGSTVTRSATCRRPTGSTRTCRRCASRASWTRRSGSRSRSAAASRIPTARATR